jgi:hypothetical protein
MDGVIHGSLQRNRLVQPTLVNHNSFGPAQQRREGIKVPDILAAEFSLLTGNGS